MTEFCPLCRSKIVAVQFNLVEKILLCESLDCPWPRYEENFTFIPSIINLKENLTDETDKDVITVKTKKKKCIKKNSKSKQNDQLIPISTELSLYTPPVTPSPPVAKTDITKITNIKSNGFYTSKESSVSHNNSVENQTNVKNLLPPVKSIFDVDSSVPLNILTKNKKDNTISNKKKRIKSSSKPKIKKIETTNIDVKKLKIERNDNYFDEKLNLTVDNNELDSNLPKKNENDFDEIFNSLIMTENTTETYHQYNFNMDNDKNYKNYDQIEQQNAVTNLQDFHNAIVNTPQTDSTTNYFIDEILLQNDSTNFNTTEVIDDDWINSLLM